MSTETAEVTRLRERIADLKENIASRYAANPQKDLTHTAIQRFSGHLDPGYFPICADCVPSNPKRFVPASDMHREFDWPQSRWCTLCQSEEAFAIHTLETDLKIACDDLLDELCTVECWRCEGPGETSILGFDYTCDVCNGRGRVLPEGVLDPTDY